LRKKPALSLVSLLLITAAMLLATGTPTTAQTPSPGATGTGTPTANTTPKPGATTTPDTQSGDRFFPETGFTVPAVFMKYWNAHGGLPIFGFPISDAHTEKSKADGKDYTVQYFERNRFESHPEFAGTQNEVLLGLLGVELNKDRVFPTADAFANTDTKVYFPQTKHSLSEPFLSYWRKNGGLAIFGYPISEVLQEGASDGKLYLVQYFERNRFEYHPENQPPYDVLLGLLGRELKVALDAVNPWGVVPGGLTPVDPLILPTKPAYGQRFLKGPKVGDGMIVQAYYQDKERIFNMINDLSYTWIKQQIEWKDTENPKGVYYWDEADRIVNSARQHNVNVMLSIVKAPGWETGGYNGLPKDPRDLQDFMTALATHFKDRVGAYEIWNEQNLSGETGDVNPGRYVEVLKAGYLGVKAGDPNAVVVSGALAPTGINDPKGTRAPGAQGAESDTRFLEDMYQYNNGEVRRYFDVLGSHPYGFNNPPDTKWPDNPNLSLPVADWYNKSNSFYFRRIEEQRSVMEKYGDGQKQMWLTEFGWCSDFRPDGYGECKYNTLDQQGQYIVGAIQRARQYYPWMGVMFLWNLNFSTFQEWYTGPSHFSIINGDWSPRPAYYAIKNRPK
jgi:polysaccharide biosynthesis protein PslG